jgi:membrane-associated protease RseP (regulator of RpoE activity)
MLNIVGIVLGALAILASVSLHEAGHMGTAKAFGMKVTRYFVGFGPTLFSFRRGDTEYGVKLIPVGGFVKITGMTPQDDDADDTRAMWRFPVWKRTIVMAAGSVVHFILAFLILWGVAANAAMPNPDNLGPSGDPAKVPAYISVAPCVPLDLKTDCNGLNGPAKAAGIRDNDRITAVGTMKVETYADLVAAIRSLKPNEEVQITYVRDGKSITTALTPIEASRPPIDDPSAPAAKVAAIGVGVTYDPTLPRQVEYSAGGALPRAADLMGQSFTGVIAAFKKLPDKVPGLISAIGGGERDPESPVSVVGASRITGEAVEYGSWAMFFLIIAALNFFIGVFNLLPLLPLDGGHIAIAWFEKVRAWLYGLIGRADPGRVDYFKLMPITYLVILIGGGFTLLTVAADIVNPITLFGW